MLPKKNERSTMLRRLVVVDDDVELGAEREADKVEVEEAPLVLTEYAEAAIISKCIGECFRQIISWHKNLLL